MSPNQYLKKRLWSLRKEKGISQAELAGLIGRSRITIIRWESGKFEPCINDLVKIARVFEVSVDYLLGNGSRTRM
jgi:transcriptional regulator with XRE-family HTH domain